MFSTPQKKQKVSPLLERPLRLPGQSLDDRMGYLIDEEFSPYLFLVVATSILVIVEWIHWGLQLPPEPVRMTMLASIIVLFSYYKLKTFFPELKNVKLGRDGERLVGMDIANLNIPEKRVFHDFVNPKGNIDHILISPNGIFTIETKTWSKLSERKSQISFDGKYFWINGYRLKEKYFEQTKAEAAYLHNLLGRATGKYFWVQPVVLFPGYDIEQSVIDAAQERGVWLLNPKMLEEHILSKPVSLTPQELSQVSHLIDEESRKEIVS